MPSKSTIEREIRVDQALQEYEEDGFESIRAAAWLFSYQKHGG
jgi:hypothetical protein